MMMNNEMMMMMMILIIKSQTPLSCPAYNIFSAFTLQTDLSSPRLIYFIASSFLSQLFCPCFSHFLLFSRFTLHIRSTNPLLSFLFFFSPPTPTFKVSNCETLGLRAQSQTNFSLASRNKIFNPTNLYNNTLVRADKDQKKK